MSSLMPSLKMLSGWQMKLFLDKVAQTVLWVKYAKTCKICNINHISRQKLRTSEAKKPKNLPKDG